LHIKTASKGSIKELTKSLMQLDRELELVHKEIVRGRNQDARNAKKKRNAKKNVRAT